MTLKADDDRNVREKSNTPCLLCGDRSGDGLLGVFNANDQKRIGAPKGKTRLLLYRICKECWERMQGNPPLEEIERKLFSESQVQ